MTVSPLVAFPETSFPTLVVWDFNIHHPLPDPLRFHSADELATSFPYFSRSSELGFGLLNQPGVCTRFPLGGSGRPSVLDLSFASPLLLPFCQTWDTPLPSTGSNHIPVQIILSHPLTSPLPPSPNWGLTGLLSPHYLRTSSSPGLLLSPPDSLSKPGSTDISHASPLSSPPTRPPSAPPTARSPGGPPYFPYSERNSTLPQGRPAPPSSPPTVQPPTSPRKATSRPSRPPRQLTRGPS